MTTTEVDNWPATPRRARPGSDGALAKHAERFETEIIFDHIHTVDLKQRPFTLNGDPAPTPATR
jgi:thioredoxin reductase (NADPH)